VRRALLLLVASLAVAGCGGGSTLSFDPAASAATTSGAGTAKVAFDTSVTAAGQDLHMTGEGAVDFAERAATMTFDVGDLLQASGLPATAGERWTVLTNGLLVYMRAPTLSRRIPGGKQWLKLDVEQLAKSRNLDLGQLQQLTQGDPTQMLDYLKAVSGKIEEVGSEDVRGVPTTHYRAKVDLDKVADQAPANVRDALRTSIQSLERRLGSHELPIDVWVDSENRVRRVAEHLTVALGGSVDFTVDLYDFGTPVSVTAPPASDTTDLGPLLGG
jgi:hypothetical protein